MLERGHGRGVPFQETKAKINAVYIRMDVYTIAYSCMSNKKRNDILFLLVFLCSIQY
jgi:hypothetical protein